MSNGSVSLKAVLADKQNLLLTGMSPGNGFLTRIKYISHKNNVQFQEFNCMEMDTYQFRQALFDFVIRASNNSETNFLLCLSELDNSDEFVKRDAEILLVHSTEANQLRIPNNIKVVAFANDLSKFDPESLARNVIVVRYNK